ncbi:MAG: hypothetical protein JOZ08_22425 [Verrucomicrobia bacterium]|nr:hypothetical protein [Verrucomicrobiota bacterium]
MVPQQAHYQFRWLNVFEHTWACPFAICCLLFAIPAVTPTIPSNLITVPGDDGVTGVPGDSL